MSYIKKRQKEQIHNDLVLEEYDEKHVFVKLLKLDYKDYWNENFEDVNAVWKKRGWIINKSQLDKLKVIMASNMEESEDAMSDSDEKEDIKGKKKRKSKLLTVWQIE